MAAGTESGVSQDLHHGAAILAPDLQHGSQFFVEQRGKHAIAQAAGDLRKAFATVDIVHQRVVAESVEIQRDADMRGEAHLADRGPQAAIGTIMVGEDPAGAIQGLYRAEEGLQRNRIGIRRLVAR
jgi:hypothetical protein